MSDAISLSLPRSLPTFFSSHRHGAVLFSILLSEVGSRDIISFQDPSHVILNLSDDKSEMRLIDVPFKFRNFVIIVSLSVP